MSTPPPFPIVSARQCTHANSGDHCCGIAGAREGIAHTLPRQKMSPLGIACHFLARYRQNILTLPPVVDLNHFRLGSSTPLELGLPKSGNSGSTRVEASMVTSTRGFALGGPHHTQKQDKGVATQNRSLERLNKVVSLATKRLDNPCCRKQA